jgi:hypothetical protein
MGTAGTEYFQSAMSSSAPKAVGAQVVPNVFGTDEQLLPKSTCFAAAGIAPHPRRTVHRHRSQMI